MIGGSDPVMGIQITDVVTLKQLKSFACKEGSTQLFAISTGSCLFTWLGHNLESFISWDLRTCVLVSKISIGEGRSTPKAHSITYSSCGTMFKVLFKGHNTTAINIYNVLSDTPMYHYSVKGLVTNMLWTNGGCVRFATLAPQTITVWEVRFTSRHPPIEVTSLATPNDFDPSKKFLFLSTQFQLAFVLEKSVTVWDTQHSKFLLDPADVEEPRKMSFSPDGRLFACGTNGSDIHLWKETPTSYIHH